MSQAKTAAIADINFKPIHYLLSRELVFLRNFLMLYTKLHMYIALMFLVASGCRWCFFVFRGVDVKKGCFSIDTPLLGRRLITVSARFLFSLLVLLYKRLRALPVLIFSAMRPMVCSVATAPTAD